MDENIDIDNDDYDFASMRNRDQFGQNQIQKNVSLGQGRTFGQKENISHTRYYIQIRCLVRL